ncbi:hypothetical protein [Campylobacter hyointestinalis]|nr:hypothetical protein [Campylobacter hyointestinalis]
MTHKDIYTKRRVKAWIFMMMLGVCAYSLSLTELFAKLGISALIIAVVLGAFF